MNIITDTMVHGARRALARHKRQHDHLASEPIFTPLFFDVAVNRDGATNFEAPRAPVPNVPALIFPAFSPPDPRAAVPIAPAPRVPTFRTVLSPFFAIEVLILGSFLTSTLTLTLFLNLTLT